MVDADEARSAARARKREDRPAAGGGRGGAQGRREPYQRVVRLGGEEKFLANSAGARIEQTRTRIAPGFYITAVDKQSGKFDVVQSLSSPRGAGWDYAESLGLAAAAAEAAEQAREKLAARPVAPGKYDLVLDATHLWLTLHESAGHSTELDRALGWEANYAGTSFVTPEKRGQLRFGNELMTVMADRKQEGGLSTVAFDDDGVRTEGAGFAIVEKGVFKNYQMAIGQAHLIGEQRSNGCAYADGPMAFPLQRMPNISLQPNDRPSTREDLIGGVENGVLVLGAGSYSIDQQRHNFQFSGQLFYEIKNGKRGAMLRDFAYQGRTEAFWNSMDGLGDRSTHHLGGTFSCGKGEPGQLAPVSHGCVAARFRGVNVLNTERGDI
jgi:TldD protein